MQRLPPAGRAGCGAQRVLDLCIRPHKSVEFSGQSISRALHVLRDVSELFEGREQIMSSAAIQTDAIREFAQSHALRLLGDVAFDVLIDVMSQTRQACCSSETRVLENSNLRL